MVEKEGTETEEEAKKAYRAAREDSNDTAERTVDAKVSSALINRVGTSFSFGILNFSSLMCVLKLVTNFLGFPNFRLMPCSISLKKKLMTWMPKLVIVGDYLIGMYV